MINNQEGQGTYSTVNTYEERGMATNSGSITGLGIKDDVHGISRSYFKDTHTSLAAKNTKNKIIGIANKIKTFGVMKHS